MRSSQFAFPRSASRDAGVLAGSSADHICPIRTVGRNGSSKVRKDPVTVGVSERAITFIGPGPIGEREYIETICRPKMKWPSPLVVERDANVYPVSLNLLVSDLDGLRRVLPTRVKGDASGSRQLLSASGDANSRKRDATDDDSKCFSHGFPLT